MPIYVTLAMLIIVTIVSICGALGLFNRPRSTRFAAKWIKKWSGNQLFPSQKVTRFFVYFLDWQDEVQFLPLKQFLKMSWPEAERPKVWLCYLEMADKRELHLGWSDGQNRNWHFLSITTLDGYLDLIDCNGKKIPIDMAKSHTDKIKTILQIAGNFSSVDEYTLKVIADYAIPELLKTKGTMGQSNALANIRAALTLGPKLFQSKETVDFETISYLVR